MKLLVARNSTRETRALGPRECANDEDLSDFLARMRDEYESGLDLVPTARMEREHPEIFQGEGE